MPLTDQEKENIISQALMTDEGRTALAQAMVDPIQAMVEPINESMFLFGMHNSVDELPTKNTVLECLYRYEKNIAKGKKYNSYTTRDINKIYRIWDIKKGEPTIFFNTCPLDPLDFIESRFDILDL